MTLHHLKMIHNYYSVLKIKKYKREVRGAAPHLAPEVLLQSREEQGGAEEIDKKLSKTKTNSETHFRPNNIIIEFSLITATFWIPHTSFYIQD